MKIIVFPSPRKREISLPVWSEIVGLETGTSQALTSNHERSVKVYKLESKLELRPSV